MVDGADAVPHLVGVGEDVANDVAGPLGVAADEDHGEPQQVPLPLPDEVSERHRLSLGRRHAPLSGEHGHTLNR
jgi:hypothetical protein